MIGVQCDSGKVSVMKYRIVIYGFICLIAVFYLTQIYPRKRVSYVDQITGSIREEFSLFGWEYASQTRGTPLALWMLQHQVAYTP